MTTTTTRCFFAAANCDEKVSSIACVVSCRARVPCYSVTRWPSWSGRKQAKLHQSQSKLFVALTAVHVAITGKWSNEFAKFWAVPPRTNDAETRQKQQNREGDECECSVRRGVDKMYAKGSCYWCRCRGRCCLFFVCLDLIFFWVSFSSFLRVVLSLVFG